MILAKIDNKKRKLIIKIVAGVLLCTNILLVCNNYKLNGELATKASTIKSLKEDINSIQQTNEKLEEELSIKINSESDIRIIREELIDKINSTVESRNLKIDQADILRALNSSENRIMDEYIRVAALALTVMELESGFKHINSTNTNGTTDHGIMQINEVVIPHLKKELGDDIDPINSKDDNVEGGTLTIYQCYTKAKEKHPEDVMWWTYAYYNRGLYFESTDSWKNPNNPNYNEVHKQADARSKKFKECYEAYYNGLTNN